MYYFGNTKVNTARNPKSGLDSDGPATGIRGPTPNEIVCFPNLVTPVTMGFTKANVVLVAQFCVISALIPRPAPLFQLCVKKGCKYSWLTSGLSLLPAKDHI